MGARLEHSKQLVLDIEEELAGRPQPPASDSQFRKVINFVFGEEPKRPKR
jgi:hypothetical protein